MTPAHGLGHPARTLLETFATRDVIVCPEQMGVDAQSLLLIGDDAQSRLCLDSAPLDSPPLAAVASGVARNLDEAGRALARPHTAIQPDTPQAATYDEAYSPYRRLFRSLNPLFT